MIDLYKHRVFALEMAKKELLGRNKGAVIGFFWLIVAPFIQVIAYIFVAHIFFQNQGDSTENIPHYLYILSGQIPWFFMTKSLQDAPSLIRDRTDIVKQLSYPIETLPVTSLITACVGTFSVFTVFVFIGLGYGIVNLNLIFLPFAFLLLASFLIGISWCFMVVGVFLKDLREIVAVVMNLMAFFSPVVLNEDMVSDRIWTLIMLNPLAHVVVAFRDIFWGEFHMDSWIIFGFMAIFFFALGYIVLRKAKIAINEHI